MIASACCILSSQFNQIKTNVPCKHFKSFSLQTKVRTRKLCSICSAYLFMTNRSLFGCTTSHRARSTNRWKTETKLEEIFIYADPANCTMCSSLFLLSSIFYVIWSIINNNRAIETVIIDRCSTTANDNRRKIRLLDRYR